MAKQAGTKRISIHEEKNLLSLEDIHNLIKTPFDKKIDITKKITEYYRNGGFDDTQMQNAARIFGTLIKDTEIEIRNTLIQTIQDQPTIPQDVIINLANDIQTVTIPVLQFSDVLTDADLIEIVNSSENAEKQISLYKNITSQSEDDKEAAINTTIERESLPVTIVESLASTISDTIYKTLSEKHKEVFELMNDVISKSREIATMKVMGLKTSDTQYTELYNLMETLKISEDIAPIYALCIGNLNIFEVNIARITKTPVLNIRTLMQDTSNRGFKVLYERAGLPVDLYYATVILVTVLREMLEKEELLTNGMFVTKDTANKMISKVIKIAGEVDSIKNLDYILSLINHHTVKLA